MPLIAQICMVLVTIAVAWMAVVAIRLMAEVKVLIQNANTSLAEVPGLVGELKRTAARADELLEAFSRITKATQASVSGVEAVAKRTTELASSLLEEVERPITKAIHLIRGVRYGANSLIQRWTKRAANRNQPTQGEDHVREQQWLDDGGVPRGSSSRRWAGSDLRTDGR